MARTWRALAALLSYPVEDLRDAAPDIAAMLRDEGILTPGDRTAIGGFLDELAAADIYDLRERYVALFDRGRAVSLHLFEHVHGESRDRGQAMADLRALYAEHGLDPDPRELPDYLPLFLEFLSLVPETEARALLAEPAAILRMLADRLAERDPGYATVMDILARLANAPTVIQADSPVDDPDDLDALDAAWEETAVRFGPGDPTDGCGVDRLRIRLRAGNRDKVQVMGGEQ